MVIKMTFDEISDAQFEKHNKNLVDLSLSPISREYWNRLMKEVKEEMKPKKTIMNLTQKITKAIWEDVCDRSGFGFESLDDDVQTEIKECWDTLVSQILQSETNRFQQALAKIAEEPNQMGIISDQIVADFGIQAWQIAHDTLTHDEIEDA